MPTLSLKLSHAQDSTRCASLAAALIRITADTLGKREAVTALVVEELAPQRWFIGGQVPQRVTAMLEVRITAGTNSADQKAHFIAAAFAELEHQLAQGDSLESASYVVVHELPATDWGYGGRTQWDRRTRS